MIFFFSKKFEIEFDSYFDLCWRAEINIQVSLNMHLYVDIGDASSSLWGSTSSFPRIIIFYQYFILYKNEKQNTAYERFCGNYASPSSGEAYRDRRLSINFELWVEIFCVPTCFHIRIPNPCLSVCPSVKIWFFFQKSSKFEFWLLTKRWNHLSFVNISIT